MSAPVLSGAALALDRGLLAAVRAAQAHDVDEFATAVAHLATLDPHHVRRMLDAVVRPALEQQHPDGVDGDDLADLLEATVTGSAWAGAVDPLALAVVLTGAFGVVVATPEELPHPVPDAEITRHALLLLGHVLPGPRHLRPALDAAWREVARADLQD